MVAPLVPVRALLFDMDGTLVDSETQTDSSIAAVTSRHGVAGFTLPATETRGRTWTHVADRIRALTPIDVPAQRLAAELVEHWNAATDAVQPLPGALAALQMAAAQGLRLAVVSSSQRASIARIMAQIGAAHLVEQLVGADDVRNGKPDPECFLLAARAFGVAPAEALVFEDSRAGLLAARAAGMRSMFVTHCAADVAGNALLATASCTHYGVLSPAFWSQIASGSLEFAGKAYS